jgi:ABC-2 type transport system permease protein
MSAPATPLTRVLAQARFETMTLLRNGEQLLVAIVLPAMALVGLTLASYPDLGSDRRIDVVAPGVLALAVASTAFTGQAISTAFDRRYGVLRMYGVSPLGRGGLLAGKSLAVLAMLAVQVVVLTGLALVLGWRPALGGLLPALVGMMLGVAAFVGLALLLAGTVRAEGVLALANLLWVVFLGLGLLIPVAVLPAWAQPVAQALPSGALGEALRAALVHGAWPWSAWMVLLAWTAASWALALRLFRWAP